MEGTIFLNCFVMCKKWKTNFFNALSFQVLDRFILVHHVKFHRTDIGFSLKKMPFLNWDILINAFY